MVDSLTILAGNYSRFMLIFLDCVCLCKGVYFNWATVLSYWQARLNHNRALHKVLLCAKFMIIVLFRLLGLLLEEKSETCILLFCLRCLSGINIRIGGAVWIAEIK